MKSFRKWIKRLLPVIAVFMIAGLILSRVFSPESSELPPEATIQYTQAADFEGRVVEVCGLVAGADYAEHIGGQPTFLNFGAAHPNQVFTVVIWGDDRPRWLRPPELKYAGAEICVTGRVRMHRGIPQIVADNPHRIEIRNISE
jgi:DNA/RNA endonuclease YhcR with UshA esterase domain